MTTLITVLGYATLIVALLVVLATLGALLTHRTGLIWTGFRADLERERPETLDESISEEES